MAGMGLLVMSPGGLRNPAMVQGFWRLVAQYRATLVGAVRTSVGAPVLEVPLEAATSARCAPLLRRRVAAAGGATTLPAGHRLQPVRGLWGMTEASGLIAVDAAGGDGGAGSVGWALPYTEVVVCRLQADGRPGPPRVRDR